MWIFAAEGQGSDVEMNERRLVKKGITSACAEHKTLCMCVSEGTCGGASPLRPMCVCPSSHHAGPSPAKNPRKLSAAAISYYSSGLKKGREKRGWGWQREVQFLPLLCFMAFSAGGVSDAVAGEITPPWFKSIWKEYLSINSKLLLKEKDQNTCKNVSPRVAFMQNEVSSRPTEVITGGWWPRATCWHSKLCLSLLFSEEGGTWAWDKFRYSCL